MYNTFLPKHALRIALWLLAASAPAPGQILDARDLNASETRSLDRPGWKVLVFPVIPLGAGGANEIGRRYSFPGTFAVRLATLRAVYMDLAAELGEQGFRWVFLVHGHAGSPRSDRHTPPRSRERRPK